MKHIAETGGTPFQRVCEVFALVEKCSPARLGWLGMPETRAEPAQAVLPRHGQRMSGIESGTVPAISTETYETDSFRAQDSMVILGDRTICEKSSCYPGNTWPMATQQPHQGNHQRDGEGEGEGDDGL